MINKIILTGLFVVVINAQSPDELYSNALEDLESGNISSAVASFNSALEMDPTFAPLTSD